MNHQIGVGSNGLTEYQLAIKCGKLEELEDGMKKSEDAYAKQVCKWLRMDFNGNMYIDKSIESTSVTRLDELLSSKIGKEISAVKDEKGVSDLDRFADQMAECISTSQRSTYDVRKGQKSRGKANIKKMLEGFGLPYELVYLDTKKYCIDRKPE